MNALTLVIDDGDALRAFYDDHLAKGRAWIAGDYDIDDRAHCELVIEHQGSPHRLLAEVVHVRRQEPGRGVALVLAPMTTDAEEALRGFVETALPASLEPVESSAAEEALVDPAPEAIADSTSETTDTPEQTDGEEDEEAGVSLYAPGESVADKVRRLSNAEQLRLAAGGTLAERTALERLCGSAVWETLLRNPRLTLPEVARIARKGSLPRPMVDLIAATVPWLASGEVQRALLSNPRSSPVVINKVFNVMPRHDLMLVPQQTAYPETVRSAAKRRLGR